jgi:RNA polymerase sigma-70 factor (ECF subfamily)
MTAFDITRHLDAMRRYARVLTRADAEADDLVQGALLRACERRAGFREGADLRVWLMTILHNLFVDQMRARRSALAREQAWVDANPGFAPPEGEHVVRLEQLRQAFLSLPAEQREALHLMAVEGLSVAEAASVLAIPAGTVMSRVGRARAALRRFEDGHAQGRAHSPLKLVRGRDDR